MIPSPISGVYEMNGNRYLLDTNAIIQLFDGNGEIEKILNKGPEGIRDEVARRYYRCHGKG